ncbi:MAG: hypothetical protein FJ207_10425 [Gemmatimonadetes bacterium]|nr:hypothetical protein [Gemmatimonadota bacterium]
MKADSDSVDPGVPEALPRTLVRLREQLGVPAVDSLWIFPPFRRGRREQGLIAVSTFQPDGERRGVVTVTYSAEETGKGITVDASFTREGEAPPDRFPILMKGVVLRGGEERGEPREVEIGGSTENFDQLLEEFPGDWTPASIAAEAGAGQATPP